MSEAADKLIERIARKVSPHSFAGTEDDLDATLRFIADVVAEYESSQWVDVRERLPEAGQRIMTFDPSWGGDNFPYYELTYQEGKLAQDVTHWRPLPAPPVIAQKERI